MSEFAAELISVRQALGHPKANAFFTWLKKRGLGCNYSYYMRLEQGALPSEKIVNQIASAVKGKWADRLVAAYCRAQFPKYHYLFPSPSSPVSQTPQPVFVPTGQRDLTPRQISTIAENERNYQLFLLCTLARKPISNADLKEWFSDRELAGPIKSLEGAGVIQVSAEGISANSVEARFPEAYNDELKAAYAKFDRWDAAFGEHFNLKLLLDKVMIRRVSGRYLGLIHKQFDLLFDLVRSSDETDLRFNENVLQLNVVIRQGKLPG